MTKLILAATIAMLWQASGQPAAAAQPARKVAGGKAKAAPKAAPKAEAKPAPAAPPPAAPKPAPAAPSSSDDDDRGGRVYSTGR